MNATAKLIITILSFATVIAILAGLYLHVFKGFSPWTSGKTVSDEKHFEGNVDRLDVDVNFADLVIKTGSDVSVSYKMPESLVPSITFEGGTLKVKSKGNKKTTLSINGDYDIIITVPEGVSVNSVDINTNAGNVDISDLSGTKISVDADAGNIKCKNINMSIISVDADAGNFDGKNISTDSLSVDMDAGNLVLNDCSVDQINADVNAGNIESHNCTIRRGKCKVDMGNISLSGDIGDVSVKASLGNTNINRD